MSKWLIMLLLLIAGYSPVPMPKLPERLGPPAPPPAPLYVRFVVTPEAPCGSAPLCDDSQNLNHALDVCADFMRKNQLPPDTYCVVDGRDIEGVYMLQLPVRLHSRTELRNFTFYPKE